MVKKLIIPILFFVSFIFFILLAYHILDPDFGWHYEMGKYILSHGIPRFDPFSYTMPSYLFIDHEWLTNVGIYFFSNHGGTVLLSFFWSAVLFLALFIPLLRKRNVFSDSLLFLSLAVILTFFRINPQVLSWLYFALLISVLFRKSLWDRFKFVLPILVLLWVNTHGSFAIAIALIGVKCAIESVEKKRIVISSMLVFILSCVASCLTPYGPRIWYEVWSQMTDGNLHWEISEWKSPLLVFDIVPWILYALSLVTVWKFHRVLSWTEKIIFALMFFLSLTAERHIPLFLIVSLFVMNSSLHAFDSSLSKDQKERLYVVTPIFLTLCFIFFVVRAALFYPTLLQSPQSTFPQNAITYMKHHPVNGHIFTVYQWGGYFLWQLPGEKDFIDGRMPSWRRSTAPKNESTYAMKEYNALLSNPKKNLVPTIQKYHISYFVLPTLAQKVSPGYIEAVREAFHLQPFLVHTPSLYASLIKQLQKQHDVLVYHDSEASVYRVTQAQ